MTVTLSLHPQPQDLITLVMLRALRPLRPNDLILILCPRLLPLRPNNFVRVFLVVFSWVVPYFIFHTPNCKKKITSADGRSTDVQMNPFPLLNKNRLVQVSSFRIYRRVLVFSRQGYLLLDNEYFFNNNKKKL